MPLIAVTAKAMKGDRQKCLDAGASDYIAKPVDIELLLALLRVWIGKGREPGAGRGRAAIWRRRRRNRGDERDQIERRRGDGAGSRRPPRRPRDRARACWSSTTTSAICSRIRTVLEDLAEVEVAASGEEALRHLLKGEFAVILLDVYMPGMDGYETARIIRGREQTKRIPIIFLSAVNKETEHLMRGYAMGAVDYVFKPVEPVVLRSKVAVFVDLFTMTREIQRKARAGAAAARRQSAGQCRAAADRAGAAPRRAAPGGDHRVAADHPLSRSRPTPSPRVPQFVGGNFAAVTGFAFDEVAARRRPCGATGSIPTTASAC